MDYDEECSSNAANVTSKAAATVIPLYLLPLIIARPRVEIGEHSR